MAEIGGCELEGEEEVEVLVGAEGEAGDGEGGGAFLVGEEGGGECCCVIGDGGGGEADNQGDEEGDAEGEGQYVSRRTGNTH